MASADDIAIVRINALVEAMEPYTDEFIAALIDQSSVIGATAKLWELKAVELSDSVDVTEAGATHKFSDLFKNAQAMRDYWNSKRLVEVSPAPVTSGRVIVRKIVRS